MQSEQFLKEYLTMNPIAMAILFDSNDNECDINFEMDFQEKRESSKLEEYEKYLHYMKFPRLFIKLLIKDFLQEGKIVRYTDHGKYKNYFNKQLYQIEREDGAVLTIDGSEILKIYPEFKQVIEKRRVSDYTKCINNLINNGLVKNITISSYASEDTSLTYHNKCETITEKINSKDKHLIYIAKGNKTNGERNVSKNDSTIINEIIDYFLLKNKGKVCRYLANPSYEDSDLYNCEIVLTDGKVLLNGINNIRDVELVGDKVERLIRERK